MFYATIWTVTTGILKTKKIRFKKNFLVLTFFKFFSFILKVVKKGCQIVSSPNVIAIGSCFVFICVSFINSEIKCNGMDGRCAYAGMSIVFSSTSSSTFWVWPFCFYLPDGQTGWIQSLKGIQKWKNFWQISFPLNELRANEFSGQIRIL